MAIERYHQALGCTLLAYMTSMIGVVTLIPFSFSVPRTLHFALHGNVSDVVTNILLFVPLGFFFQITHGRMGWKSLFGALCLGLAVSCIVEVGQLFLPSRYSSVIDIITNGVGALLGAAMAGYHRLMLRKTRIPEFFGFGLPLMSSVYLLVPMLWLDSISMGREISRMGLMALVGVFGGGVISSAVVNRFGNSLKRPRFAVFGYTTAWFMIGAAPALTHFPTGVLLVGLIVGVIAQCSTGIWEKQNSAERRFELPTLRRLLPIYLLYLLLLSLWPTTIPLGQWSIRGGFQLLNQSERVLFIARFVVEIAAFTLLGYLLAEMSGRKNETGLRSMARVFLYILGVAGLVTTLRNILSVPLYIFVEAAVFIAAAMYGAIIYRLQLAVVRPGGAEKIKKEHRDWTPSRTTDDRGRGRENDCRKDRTTAAE